MEKPKKQNQKIIVTYIYKDHIKRVFDCFKSPELFNQSLKYAENIKVLNGEHYGQIGTELKFLWNNLFNVHFIVKDVVNQENYKKIVFYTKKVKPFNLHYTLTFHFYRNSIEKKTIFVHEMQFDNSEALKTIDLNHDKQEKIELCKTMEKILKQRTEDLFQIESTLINRNIEVIWNIIIDWNKFKTFVPFIADIIEIYGKVGEVGSIIKIKDKIKDIEYQLLITKKEEKEPDDKNYFLECSFSKPKCPLQEIQFNFSKITEESTILTFKHIFHEPVNIEHIKSISKDKIKILTELKKRVEDK